MLRYLDSDTTESNISAKERRVTAQRISVGSVYTMFVNSDYYDVLQEPVPRESSTYELFGEWPELGPVVKKLFKGEELNERDEGWLREVSEETGWELNDVIDDLKNISRDPVERAEKYYSLYTEYLEEAKNYYRLNNFRQAGEKLYGAVLALIKYYAAIKGMPLIHWSRGKIERFITNNVKQELRKLFRDLLDKTQPLHEHFYEAHLDEQTFKERWIEALKLLERIHDLIRFSNTF
ncbi:MAG: PaREP1 family protein [Thermoproteota archaeon]